MRFIHTTVYRVASFNRPLKIWFQRQWESNKNNQILVLLTTLLVGLLSALLATLLSTLSCLLGNLLVARFRRGNFRNWFRGSNDCNLKILCQATKMVIPSLRASLR